MEGLCSIVIWESGLSDSAVSCEDILGYNVRLYHPESKHQNLTKHVETDKTYYKISDEDKIDHETLVQVQYSLILYMKTLHIIMNHIMQGTGTFSIIIVYDHDSGSSCASR